MKFLEVTFCKRTNEYSDKRRSVRETWERETFLQPCDDGVTAWDNICAANDEAVKRGHEHDQQIRMRTVEGDDLRGRSVVVDIAGQKYGGKIVSAWRGYAFVNIGSVTGNNICKYNELTLI